MMALKAVKSGRSALHLGAIAAVAIVTAACGGGSVNTIGAGLVSTPPPPPRYHPPRYHRHQCLSSASLLPRQGRRIIRAK